MKTSWGSTKLLNLYQLSLRVYYMGSVACHSFPNQKECTMRDDDFQKAIEYVTNVFAEHLDADGVDKLKRVWMTQFSETDPRVPDQKVPMHISDAACLVFNEMCRIQDRT